MKLWNAFWDDESGAILSAEAALLGTVGIVGATVGMSAVASSVNDELKEAAFAIRSLDQSYSYEGMKSPHAWTAGSHYQQPAVEQSLKSLDEQIQRQEQELEEKPLPAEEAPRRDRKRPKVREEASAVDSQWQIDGPALPVRSN